MNTSDSNKEFGNKYCMAITQFTAKELNRKSMMEDEELYCETDKFYGFVIFDVGTLQFYMGELKDDDTYHEILTLFYSIRPVEIIIFKKNLPVYLENFISTLTSKPLITRISKEFNNMMSFHIAEKYLGVKDKWNDVLKKNLLNEHYINISASFYLASSYLESLLIADQVN